MPQLSLYIDKETLSKIEIAAKIEKLSLSKWVVSKLKDTIEPKELHKKFWKPENQNKLMKHRYSGNSRKNKPKF